MGSRTFHRYRLDEPRRWKKQRTIFVCSMADLFGDWVPDKWIEEVFKACEAAPQHQYLFLTKNPARYRELRNAGKLPIKVNFWYGTTVTLPEQPYFYSEYHNCFLSIEPIHAYFGEECIEHAVDWIIIGAETGNRKGKVIPQKSWIEDIAGYGHASCTPIFMKNSLLELMGSEFEQMCPWD